MTGHYGSGKTEFSVSLALQLARNGRLGYKRLALCDLDIANPYFRSRERTALLEDAGVAVYAGAFRGEITAELPALAAAIKAPLEDPDCFTIVDVGGNSAGARVLHQYMKYFQGGHLVLCVVNANRPETGTVAGAIAHIGAIEQETRLTVGGLVNNCHLLTETTAETVIKGHRFCQELSGATGKPLLLDCYPAPLVKEEELSSIPGAKMPVGMIMRASWLDK